MTSWVPLRHFITLSAPLLRGPATRRLQQRRQQLLQQQAEQRTPTAKLSAAGAAAASATLEGNGNQQQQLMLLQQGPPKRIGTGLFADPMRPPEAVETSNAAHAEFLKMQREELTQRVVRQLIALRKQRHKESQQGPSETATKETRKEHPKKELPLALADVYVHFESNIRQVAPRPHDFVEAQVKDLITGASAAANLLYPPSVELEEDEDSEAPQEGAFSGLSAEQLRKVAGRVKAPAIQLVHAEAQAALANLTLASSQESPNAGGPPEAEGSPDAQGISDAEGPPEAMGPPDSRGFPTAEVPPKAEGPLSSEDIPLVWRIRRSPALEWEGLQGSPSRDGEKQSACSSLGGLGSLGPWKAPEVLQNLQRGEGDPSLMLAGAAGQMRAEMLERSSCLAEDATGAPPPPCAVGASSAAESPADQWSVGRSRPKRSLERVEFAEAAAAPFLRETLKASEHAEKAQKALLGALSPPNSSETPQPRGLLKETSAEGKFLFSDAFAESKEAKEHPQLAAFWEAQGARFGFVRDCRVPIGFGEPGSTLAAYKATRRSCCLFDVSFRRLWEVSGRDRLAFVDLLAACDIQRQMRIGDVQPSLLLDSKGLVLDECFVAKRERKVEIWGSGHAAWHVFEYLAELANFCRKSGLQISLLPSKKTCVLELQGPLAMRRFLQQVEKALNPDLDSRGCSPNANIGVALFDARGFPLTLASTAQLPFMSAWGLKLAVKTSPHRLHEVFSVSCLRVGSTGEDGIAFALEAVAAPTLAQLLLGDVCAFEPSEVSQVKAPRVSAPELGCLCALEMLRLEAGLPSMGIDVRSSHSAAQAGVARLVSFYKVRQRLLLGAEFLTKQLAVPPNVRRVAFLVGGPARLKRAERIQHRLQQQHHHHHHQHHDQQQQQEEEEDSFFAVSEEEEEVKGCFPLAGSVVVSYCQRRPIGVVTSVAWSPQLKCRVAQGLVLFEFARHREPVLFAVPQAVPRETPKWKKTKLLRGRRLRTLIEGRVHRLPLIPHNYPVPESQRRVAKTVSFGAYKKPRTDAASRSS